jgi:hypothetical protein
LSWAMGIFSLMLVSLIGADVVAAVLFEY